MSTYSMKPPQQIFSRPTETNHQLPGNQPDSAEQRCYIKSVCLIWSMQLKVSIIFEKRSHETSRLTNAYSCVHLNLF